MAPNNLNPGGFLFRKIIVLLTLVISTATLHATKPVPDAARTGYEAIDHKDMESLLKFIASDELEGRNTGSRGLKIAAKFLQSQYELAGLTPVPGQTSMLQPFSVIESRVQESTSLSVRGTNAGSQFNLYKHFVVLSKHSHDVHMTYPVVFAGFGLTEEKEGKDDYQGLDVKGKIVLAIDGSRETIQSESGARSIQRKLRTLRQAKAKAARAAGAAGIIYLRHDLTEEIMPMERRRVDRARQRLAEDPEDIPELVAGPEVISAILSGSDWTADKLVAAYTTEQNEPPRVTVADIQLQLDIVSLADTKGTQNIVAFLEGSDPELKTEVVAFGAHYDHVGMNDSGDIYNGADDDGSGTVGILEIARAFAMNPERPARSLLFVSHAGEEKGLLGSKYYTRHPIVAMSETVAQLNIDMIGRNTPNAIYIIGSNFLSQELHAINEAANEMVGLDFDYSYNALTDPNRFYYRSDHYNYAKHGVPIIFYFSGVHEDYHKPTDTVEKIDFVKMQKVARVAYLTAWHVANLDHRLAQNGLLLQSDIAP